MTAAHPTARAGSLAAPALRVGVWKVVVIIPCYGRPGDLANVLADLERLELDAPGGISPRAIVVDNASSPGLAAPGAELIRLERNMGGSGGFNAGLRTALARGTAGDPRELFWLLDSDARPEASALARLVAALERNPDLCAVASSLWDPVTREPYEAGGRIDRRTGEFDISLVPGWRERERIDVEYAAACSLLVRRRAVEMAGLLPDTFLSADDVGWSLRLKRATGARIACIPSSRVFHPHPDKMRLVGRYYGARNGFGPAGLLGLGPVARVRRAAREVGRGTLQVLAGRRDLAELHRAGLRDAARGNVSGPGEPPMVREWQAYDHLGHAAAGAGRARIGEHLRAELGEAAFERLLAAAGPGARSVRLSGGLGALIGRVLVPEAGLAIVSARARPRDVLRGRRCITCAPAGFSLEADGAWARAGRAIAYVLASAPTVARLSLRAPPVPPAEPAASDGTVAGLTSIVVLSYNRRGALERTLESLAEDPSLLGAEVIVVDNASGDGSAAMVRESFPGTIVVEAGTNIGVEGFNLGAWRARGEFLLILDDDAHPAPGAVDAALSAMRADAGLGAVALHPVHPRTGRSEWPFAASASDRFPVMGCGNLVRARAWRGAGGYEAGYFLYRNDADLALTLLDQGWRVGFDPAWRVQHDSPVAGRKSGRWFRLATRNWIWTARRHGRGFWGMAGAAAGWAWAHRLAGARPADHARVIAGAISGLCRRPPAAAAGSDGRAFRSLLRLRFSPGPARR